MSRPSRRSIRSLLPLAAALAAAGTPLATAGVARADVKLTAPDRCYIYWPGKGSQSIPVSLGGLAAGQQVRIELRVNGVTVSGLPSLTADATGAVVTKLGNWTSGLPDGPSRAARASLVASDLTTGAELAQAAVRVGNAGLVIDTSKKSSGAERRWIVSGISRLTGGRTYYAFYFRGGRQVGHQRLGRAGECGYLRTRAVLIPFKKVGVYQLRVQASPKFRRSKAWLGGTVTQRRATATKR